MMFLLNFILMCELRSLGLDGFSYTTTLLHLSCREHYAEMLRLRLKQTL